MESQHKTRPGVWVVWTVTCLLWSTVWLAIKVGVSAVPPFTFAYARLTLALALLIPIAAAQRRLRVPSRSDSLLLVISGVLLLGVNYGLVFWGAQFIPSGLVAVLQAVTPAFGLVMAAAVKSERISTAKVAGLLSGMAGVALLSLRQTFAPQSRAALEGCLAVVLGSVCVAFVYVLMKIRAPRLHPTTVVTWQTVSGAIPLVAAGLLIDGNPLSVEWSRASLAALSYLAWAGSVVAFWLNYWLLQRLPASAVLLVGVVEAPIAAFLGALVLHERFDAASVMGTALVLSGTAMVICSRGARSA